MKRPPVKLVLPLLLLVSCSGRVDYTTETREEPTTLTVCSLDQDAELTDHLQWSIGYWWERGHDVDYQGNQYCLVRVRIADKSHVVNRFCEGEAVEYPSDGWCEGEVALETHQEWNGVPQIDGWAPATITLRRNRWERMDEAWRNQTLSHELGHALGVPHSDEMPMRSCERPEWCFGESDVRDWWDGLVKGVGDGKAE
jgi:hypothetical protein